MPAWAKVLIGEAKVVPNSPVDDDYFYEYDSNLRAFIRGKVGGNAADREFGVITVKQVFEPVPLLFRAPEEEEQRRRVSTASRPRRSKNGSGVILDF